MSINPYILLGIGAFFAVTYALVITIGWWRTRVNRRAIQEAQAVSYVPGMYMAGECKPSAQKFKTFALTANEFVDEKGTPINTADYKAYIAIGTSSAYPQINNGDLILVDKSGSIKYAFTLPNLSNYR